MSSFNPNPFTRRQGIHPLDYGAQAGSPAVISFFNGVYAWMCAGLGITATVAWWVSAHPDVMRSVFSTGALILLFIAEIALVWVIASATQRLNATAATVLFLIYAALNGLTLSGILFVYTASSVAGAFVASAGMFGAMSVYGMVTQRDLSSLGRIAFMGLIGLIIASIVNLFLANSFLSWILSYVGVGVFVALTAYDTQRLRQIALATATDSALAARLAVTGALTLYLDFINLFLFMVQIMGNQRRN